MSEFYFQDQSLFLNGGEDGITIPYTPEYDFGADDFTLEIWTRGFGPGELVSRHSHEDPYRTPGEGRFGLRAETQAITFVMGCAMGGESELRAPAKICDGLWHHIALVRSQGSISMLLDGRELLLQRPDDDFNFATPIVTDLPLLVGQSRYWKCTASQQRDITQLRLWNKAKDAMEIRARMFHQLGGQEPDLVGLWNFDSMDCRDSSPLSNSGKLHGNAIIRPSDMSLYPFGKPYVDIQCRLMQDYESDQLLPLKEVTKYRVVLTPYKADGTSDLGDIEIYAEKPIHAEINDEPGVLLSPTAPFTAKVNAVGQITVALPVDDSLAAPLLKLRPSYLAADERIIATPDRHLHAVLAGVTDKQLLGQADPDAAYPDLTTGKSALLAPEHAGQAAGIQRLVNNFMKTATQERIAVATPYERMLRAVHGEAHAEETMAEEWTRTPSAFNSVDDRSRVGWERGISSEARLMDAEALEHPDFEVDLSAGTFTVLTPHQAIERCMANENNPVRYGSPLAAVFDTAPRNAQGHIELTPHAFAAMHARAQSSIPLGGLFDDLFNWCKKAAKIVVQTVSHVISEVGRAIKTVVVTIIDAAGEIFKDVLDVVGKGVEAVRGLLAKAAVAIGDAFNFFRSLFNWSDILVMQRVTSNFIEQGLRRTIIELEQVKPGISRALDKVKAQASQAISSIVDQKIVKAGQTAVGASTQEGGVQSTWVSNRLANSSQTWSSQVQGNSSWPDVNMDGLLSLEPGMSDAMSDLQGSGIQDVLSDPTKSTISSLARILDSFVGGAIELLKQGALALCDVAGAVLEWITSMLTTRIDIPVLTRLFETVIAPGSEFTVLNAISLAIAAPATVMFKLIRGGEISSSERTSLQSLAGLRAESMNWLRAERKSTRTTATESTSLMSEADYKTLVTCLACAGTFATFIYSHFQVLDDGISAASGQNPVSNWIRIPSLITLTCSIVLGFPLPGAVITKGGFTSDAEIAAYSIDLVGLTIGLVSLVGAGLAIWSTGIAGTNQTKSGALGKVATIITAICGVLGLLCALISFFVRLGAGKTLDILYVPQSILLAAPMIGQTFLLANNPKIKLICPVVTALCLRVVVAVMISRTVLASYKVEYDVNDFKFHF